MPRKKKTTRAAGPLRGARRDKKVPNTSIEMNGLGKAQRGLAEASIEWHGAVAMHALAVARLTEADLNLKMCRNRFDEEVDRVRNSL